MAKTFKAQVSQDVAKIQVFRQVSLTKKNLLMKLKTFHALKILAKKSRSRLESIKLFEKLVARKLKA
jgi:CHAD domain-containing protein